MNKKILALSLITACTMGSALAATRLKAELINGGRTRQGFVTGRDGDWISFTSGTSKPIRLGAFSIQGLNFDIKVDLEQLKRLSKEREYDRIISILNKALAPYSDYADVPTNLAKYNVFLMDMYFTTGEFDKAMALADAIVLDKRDPALQKMAQVKKVLCLIETGALDEANAMLEKFGWNADLSASSKPENLYITAKYHVAKKEYPQAMELVANIIAFNSQDPEWMQPAELLCAQVYVELGASNPIMYDSAEAVIQQMSELYKDTNEYDKASELKIKIEGLRAQAELQGNESE